MALTRSRQFRSLTFAIISFGIKPNTRPSDDSMQISWGTSYPAAGRSVIIYLQAASKRGFRSSLYIYSKLNGNFLVTWSGFSTMGCIMVIDFLAAIPTRAESSLTSLKISSKSFRTSQSFFRYSGTYSTIGWSAFSPYCLSRQSGLCSATYVTQFIIFSKFSECLALILSTSRAALFTSGRKSQSFETIYGRQIYILGRRSSSSFTINS